MARIAYTIWALLLNTFGLPIFRTCFINALEDEECEPVLSGLPVTSLLFSSGVYTIIVKTNLYPASLRKPENYVLAVYEFLASAFILEFALACIWTPIDMLFYTTAPRGIREVMKYFGIKAVANKQTPKILMAIPVYAVALGFFALTLHVTDIVDFARLKKEMISIKDGGVPQLMLKLKEAVRKEVEDPARTKHKKKVDRCRCNKSHRSKRTRTRTRSR